MDANPVAQSLMGYELDELKVGDPWRFSNTETPDGKLSDTVAKEYMKRAYYGEIVKFPWTLLRDDGKQYFTEVVLTAIKDEEGTLVIAQITDISDNKRNTKLIKVQGRILEEIAMGVSLPVILDSICREIEIMVPSAVATVMKLNEDNCSLSLVAGPSALGGIRQAFEHIPLGIGNGSCGSAAFSGQGEFVENTYSDARWENIRDIAIQFGLKSCWSMPVIGIEGIAIGTVAISQLKPCSPNGFQTQILESMSSLAGLAMQNDHRRVKMLEYAQQFRSIVNALPDLVFILAEDGEYLQIYGNDNQQNLLTKKKEALLGKKLQEFLPELESKEAIKTIQKTIQTQQPQIIEYKLRVPAGDTWFEGRTAPIELPETGPAVMWVARDVTEKKIAEEVIEHLAYHDALTDLPNRTLFMNTLKTNLSYAKRHELIGAIMFMDVDNFKEINDEFGHHIADLILQGIASRVKSKLRKEDTIARIGGDEFVIMIAGLSEGEIRVKEEIAIVAKKILKTVGKSFDINTKQLKVTCSIGIVLFPDASQSEEELLRKADLAMYQAKKAGKNAFCFFEKDPGKMQ